MKTLSNVENPQPHVILVFFLHLFSNVDIELKSYPIIVLKRNRFDLKMYFLLRIRTY